MNNLVIVSGPSGSGKSSLIRLLRQDFPEIGFSVSHTTRPKGPLEEEGHDYYFIERAQFQSMIDQGAFIEWAEVYGHFYGTSFAEIERCSRRYVWVILDVDVVGAQALMTHYPESLSIMIIPPTLKQLTDRIRKRTGRADDNLDVRLAQAQHELKAFHRYRYVIVNESLPIAYEQFKIVFLAQHQLSWRFDEVIRMLMTEE
jgi:guanylate kinase